MSTHDADIPFFKLYGEEGNWVTPDLIHCETIAERSRLHHWEIKPHRHTDLAHLLYCQTGTAVASLDGTEQLLQTPCILLAAPMCVHGFRFSEDIEGYVLTLAPPLLKQLADLLGDHQSMLSQSHCYNASEDKAFLDTLFVTLNREYSGHEPGRESLIEATVNALIIVLSRQALALAEKTSPTPDRGSQHFTKFSRLLEREFRNHTPIETYAHRLGITAAHLNSLCRRFAQRTALQLIHDRLLLEAKRNLIYTSMTISQVSDSLGFSEPAYFTRFFKRLASVSPKEFRQQPTATAQ
ncbi:helix-turn-helix domain-containing protein [Aestuariicella hydrocarbonica]|uniref:Helix-turn-helix domain-containing protein n=1 Tax=Pseudomaricurvus hydrocarbonicus TaxID=1470433 RepID=A0A9E5JWD8_9GAMM|nr:helix-turn-helix domain-containing protein [Aestuariicella hydrocarbonica]NHO66808.1 helix-turn-helix domain-containing protein [Aestuariicella hydrocarbonica]